jgi:hypothetical protein
MRKLRERASEFQTKVIANSTKINGEKRRRRTETYVNEYKYNIEG